MVGRRERWEKSAMGLFINCGWLFMHKISVNVLNIVQFYDAMVPGASPICVVLVPFHQVILNKVWFWTSASLISSSGKSLLELTGLP